MTAEMPKIELHLHLEGAAPPEFIRRLADEKRMDLSQIFTPDGGFAYRDFWHFLEVYEAATGVLTGPEEFHRLVLAVCEASAAQGVVYTETFVSPDFCGGGDLGAWREYLAAMQEAAGIAEARHGITMRGVVTCIRHLGPEKAKAAALCAAETAGDWIVGFGIAGDERAGASADFHYSFDMAREAKLGITAHAGEWNGADEVAKALDHLRPSRIGHGVRAIEDDAVMYRLAEAGTVLEVCPGSNVFLGVFPSWADHPIEKLRSRGVKVTVSTDDPPFFRTTLGQEYERLAETFQWDETQFRDVNQTALTAAFCDDKTRERIAKLLEPSDD